MGVSSEDGSGGPLRRTVLTALPTALALAALAGCTSAGTGPDGGRRSDGTRTPSADDAARLRAVATTRELLAAVTAARTLPATLRAAVADDHRAQLTALGAATDPNSTTALAAEPTPTGSPTDATPPRPPSARAVVRAEAAAATQALADVGAVGREVATLLVRIAAARAAHADLIARATRVPLPGRISAAAGSRPDSAGISATPAADTATTPSPAPSDAAPAAALPTLSPSPRVSLPAADLDALARLVEAEHAAVFGYAIVVPRVRGSRAPRAQALWDAHRTARDVLEAQLVAAGSEPPAALPAYAVDVPSTAAGAAALAASLEAGVSRVAIWAAGRAGGDVRRQAAELAVTATRRRVEWTAKVPPFTQ